MYVASGEMKDQTRNELPEDIKVDTLTESQWRELRHLKSWIYEQRVKHRKEKARGERREVKEEAMVKELETKPVQPSFF
jgi:CO dehydrogenase/acetyl-CoA synthase beta subunit